MQRPPLEVADIVRAAGKKFIENSREWITAKHLKVFRAIDTLPDCYSRLSRR